MIAAGELNTRITIETVISGQSARGAETLSWTSAGQIWASVQPISGRWVRIAEQHAPTATVRVTIRSRVLDVRATRFTLGNRILRIESSIDSADGRELLCSETVADETEGS